MAWFSTRRGDAPSSTGAAEASAAVGSGLDALGRLVRILGEDAFDIDQGSAAAFQQKCEGWARHLLTAGTSRVRFADLLKDLQRRRKQECAYVTRTTAGLKSAVWEVVVQVREAAAAHGRDDQRVQAQLSRLQDALAAGDVESIRGVAQQTVRVVSDTIVARQERSAQALSDLGSRMKSLESSLLESRSLNRTDGLTGLQNRRALDDDLPRLMTMAQLSGEPIGLLMVDIDHFKKVNDTHGHPVGDAVLRSFADALVRAFPRKRDYIARYGGEEFVVVLTDTEPAQTHRLAERFLSQLRVLDITHDNATLRVTASIGVADAGPHEEATAAVARADQALYAAKRGGRDRVVVASR